MSQSPVSIGVGMLGYAFMGRAHANAYRTLRYMTWPPPLVPELVSVAGRSHHAVADAAERFGFDTSTTNWRDLVDDPRVELFDNSGPNNLHAEPTLAAAREGKHVFCEKPLGRDAAESFELWRSVEEAGVKHMCAFNYRFVPAVRLARELIAAGELGDVVHFRARYLQDWLADPTHPMVWRLSADDAGSGALGDLGSHIVDLGRYLVGDPAAVSGVLRTFVDERDGGTVTVDDAFAASIEFTAGAVGTLEASRFCPGRKNALSFEVNGTRSSLAFDLERLNELQLYSSSGRKGTAGFRTILVTEEEHPFLASWWPPGHMLGWEHSFVHEIHHLLAAIAADTDIEPHGATFQDGYQAAEICDAIARSSMTGERQEISYRTLAEETTPAS